MRDIGLEEIERVLERHRHWQAKDCENWQEMRAVFKDVRFVDLVLNRYDFIRVKFENVTFVGGCFCCCCFSATQMKEVTFKSVRLIDCEFNGATIDSCDFRCCYCIGDSFDCCFISDSSFYGSFLTLTHFDYGRIARTSFRNTNCSGKVGFSNVTFIAMNKKDFPLVPMICPSEGAFIGWKKVKIAPREDGIVKLLIPADAKRCSAGGKKCRCDKAIVLGIWRLSYDESCLKEEIEEAYSFYDHLFRYKRGDVITPTGKSFDDNRWEECSSGIHFFVDKQVAIDYSF